MTRLRLGVIGAGSWTVASHLPAFARHRDTVGLSIVNRRDPEALERIRSGFGFQRASSDWRDVIEERPDIVLVASPAALHFEQAEAALEAGAHVLCEKPMTVAAADAWRLAAMARDKGLAFVVAFGWNYNQMVIEARELFGADGGIGEVEHVAITMASSTRELLSDQGSYADASASTAPRFETWTDPALSGGGYGQAQLSHALGVALWITGLRAREVFAWMSTDAIPGVELHDAITLRYANGAIGTLSGTSSHSGANGNKHEVEVRIIGEGGQLSLDLARELLWRYRPGDDRRVSVPVDAGRYDCDGPVDAIVELALGRGANRSPAELGARTVEVLEAAYVSARTGVSQKIDTTLTE
jgi:predicted dehydrogenase